MNTAKTRVTRNEAAERLLDALWADMLLDACASDGPIRDADVRQAMQRGRPKIETAERRAIVERIRAAAHNHSDAWLYTKELDAVLDAEAAR
jgi:hypothetical protein